jgi:hypothetical protein
VILHAHPALNGRTPVGAQLARLGRLLEADRARTGRPHVFGRAATALSPAEAMNASDAMISDVSAMAVDYLASGKPLALTDVRGAGPAFARHSPIAHAAYIVAADGANTGEAVAAMLGEDPNAARRAAVLDYYLAPNRFVETARRYVRGEHTTPASAIVRQRESAEVKV